MKPKRRWTAAKEKTARCWSRADILVILQFERVWIVFSFRALFIAELRKRPSISSGNECDYKIDGFFPILFVAIVFHWEKKNYEL
jgi:hypothetical protein